MLNIENLKENQACIDGKWVIARPLLSPFIIRLKDAIEVLKGNADAVKFYKQ